MMKYLILGDCAEKMRDLADNSIDAIVTDPPYGLNFMGMDFDNPKMMGQSPVMHGGLQRYPKGENRTGYADCDNVKFQSYLSPIFAEALRVAKPGAYLLAFGGTRTYHRLACAIEDAGWEVRDCIMWVYGCLSEDTEIATPQGWKRRGEIKVGDMVIAFDKTLHKTESQLVQRVFDYDYDDEAYRLVSPLTDQLISKNHRVLAEVNGVLEFVYAEFLRENDTVRVPVYCADARLSDLGVFIGHHKITTARITPVHYKGRMWCVSVPSGAIIARRNGKIFVTGNSGFPKSMDVAKAIDKSLGAEREKIRVPADEVRNPKSINGGHGVKGGDRPWMQRAIKQGYHEMDGDTPASPEAAAWQGWGTCLKPAVEPIVVARKPLEGTAATNVLKHGTGALNIDGCRVATDETISCHGNSAKASETRLVYGKYMADVPHQTVGQKLGRFPANLIHDGSPEVLALFPNNVKGGTWNRTDGARPFNNDGKPTGYSSSGSDISIGSAARFFYCAKASRSERGAFNDHCTVKPLALMRYLVRLVTRKGGIVLDPFMGSGTTGVAAIQEGMNFVGIERDPHYYEIAQKRIEQTEPETSQMELPL